MAITPRFENLNRWAQKIEEMGNFQDIPYLKNEVELLRPFLTEAGHIQQLSLLAARVEELKSVSSLEEKKVASPRNIESNFPVVETDVWTVALQNASQYDFNMKPSACTFHATLALKYISEHFEAVLDQIQKRDGDALSEIQKNIIQQGLDRYYQALRKDDHILQGADIDQIELPAGVSLQKVEAMVDGRSFQERLQTVVDHLSQPLPLNKTVFLKNGNDESFALIAKGNHTIVFDSHHNEITALSNRRVHEFLHNKLEAFSGNQEIVDAENQVKLVDFTPFAYALTAEAPQHPLNNRINHAWEFVKPMFSWFSR